MCYQIFVFAAVTVGAKLLSTEQCAPCRRLYQMGIDSTDTDLLLATYEKVPTEGGSHLTFDITVIKSLKTGEISIGIWGRTNCLWGAVILYIIYNAVGAMVIIQ